MIKNGSIGKRNLAQPYAKVKTINKVKNGKIFNKMQRRFLSNKANKQKPAKPTKVKNKKSISK